MQIAGTHVVITGAASGIGRAAALAFAKARANRVTLVDVDSDSAQHVARELRLLGCETQIELVDLADLEQVEALFQRLTLGTPIDVFINNAGVNSPTRFPEARREDLAYVMNVNLNAVILSTQLAATLMRDNRRRGAIVNTCSSAALASSFFDVAYAVAKAGVLKLTELCAGLMETHGVTVTSVLPGLVNTPMLGKHPAGDVIVDWLSGLVTQGRAIDPDQIAEAIIGLVRNGRPGEWIEVR